MVVLEKHVRETQLEKACSNIFQEPPFSSMRNFFIFEGTNSRDYITGNPKKDFLWLRTSRASVAFTLEFYRLETFRLNLYSFLLHVLNGNWNAKHCHANMPCHDLIASSFHGAPLAHYAKNGLIYLIGADYVNGIINGRRAKAKRRWKEGGRRGHSATLEGSERASETRADS